MRSGARSVEGSSATAAFSGENPWKESLQARESMEMTETCKLGVKNSSSELCGRGDGGVDGRKYCLIDIMIHTNQVQSRSRTMIAINDRKSRLSNLLVGFTYKSSRIVYYRPWTEIKQLLLTRITITRVSLATARRTRTALTSSERRRRRASCTVH